MMLLYAIAILLFSSLALAAPTCNYASGSTPPALPDADTQDAPVEMSASFTASDVLTLSFDWTCDYGAGTGSVVTPNNTRANYSYAFVSATDGTICTTDITGALLTDTSLSTAIAWSAAKTACGSKMAEVAGSNGNPDLVTFVFQISYEELIFELGTSTGITRAVTNTYGFSVSTPTRYTVESASSVTLSSTTVVVSAQSGELSVSKALNVVLTIVSECGNTPSWGTSPGLTASALILSSAGAGTINSIGGAVPGVASPGLPSGSLFAGLCTWTGTVQITPASTSCTITGVYTVQVAINSGAPMTFTINLQSNDVCATASPSVADPSFTLNLYSTYALAKGSSTVNSVGSPPSGQLSSVFVSAFYSAHGRIDVTPSFATPAITSYSISSGCWFIASTVTGTETCANVSSVPIPLGTPTFLAADSSGNQLYSGVAGSAANAKSALFFSFVWDPTIFAIPADPQPNVYILVTFDVVYSVLGKRETVQQHSSLLKAARSGSRASPNNFGVASQPLVISTAGAGAGAAGSTTTSNNVGLIAGLVAGLGAALLAGVLIFALIALRRRRNRAAQQAMSDVAVTPTDLELGTMSI